MKSYWLCPFQRFRNQSASHKKLIASLSINWLLSRGPMIARLMLSTSFPFVYILTLLFSLLHSLLSSIKQISIPICLAMLTVHFVPPLTLSGELSQDGQHEIGFLHIPFRAPCIAP